MHTFHLRRRPVRALAIIAAIGAMAFAGIASAATTVVVTQNSAGWTQDDTRPGGTVTWTEEYGAPPGLGDGSLKLTTDLTTSAKAGLYNHTMAGTPLADVDTLAYWTYQATTVQPPHAAASYQLQIDANGLDTPGGFTTLVFEPYQNVTQGVIVNGVWQKWDVDAGLFWSSRGVTDGTCLLVAGAGGPPMYTLGTVQTLCPNAVVVGIGVNIGTFNPGYTVATDGVQFNDTIYDFELGRRPSSKDDCKDGGWMTFNDPAFKNQGECIKWVKDNS
jgi:hypothetical protein